MHESSSAELLGAAGAIGFLAQFKEQAATEELLRSEEYEVSLELQVPRRSVTAV